MRPKLSEVLKPGASLIAGGRALETRSRGAGVWPYQWRYPGPNSKQVLANGSVASPGPGSSAAVVVYQVPEGMLFSLRAIVYAFFGTGWNEGTTDVTFTLSVQGAGTRKVDFLANVPFHLGSMTTPYPIFGRCEFQPMDILTVSVDVVATVAAGPPNSFAAVLSGHTYPQSEAA